MLGREEEQILTQKQLFKGQGELLGSFGIFILTAQTSCSLRILLSLEKTNLGIPSLPPSLVVFFFTPSRGSVKTVIF